MVLNLKVSARVGVSAATISSARHKTKQLRLERPCLMISPHQKWIRSKEPSTEFGVENYMRSEAGVNRVHCPWPEAAHRAENRSVLPLRRIFPSLHSITDPAAGLLIPRLTNLIRAHLRSPPQTAGTDQRGCQPHCVRTETGVHPLRVGRDACLRLQLTPTVLRNFPIHRNGHVLMRGHIPKLYHLMFFARELPPAAWLHRVLLDGLKHSSVELELHHAQTPTPHAFDPHILNILVQRHFLSIH